MNLFPTSLRWRIQLWHGLLLSLLVVGFCVAAWRYESAVTMQRAQEDLRAKLGVVMSTMPGPRASATTRPRQRIERRSEHFAKLAMAFNESDSEVPNFYIISWRPDGRVLARSPDTPADIFRPEPPSQDVGGVLERSSGEIRESFLFTPGGDSILVGRSIAPEIAELRIYAQRLTLAVGTILLIGLTVGGWLTSRTLRAIPKIASTARRIAIGELDERITKTGAGELGDLADVLNETFERLEQAFIQQQRFTADAAHELRTPTAVILSQAQSALARERDPEVYRAALQACAHAATRLQHLGESLIQLSAFDGKEQGIGMVDAELSEIASAAVTMLQPVAEARQIQIQSEWLPAPCHCSTAHIEQVVVNLLANAIQFSPDRAVIHMKTAVDEAGYAKLSVKDEGQGIDAEHLKRIFNRFYRVDSSRNRQLGGAGLGLAICQSIAAAHGGNVTATSSPGQGSVFTLRLG
ncbi:MAG: ATP-binding protein [Verrucomicrobiales bacterium]